MPKKSARTAAAAPLTELWPEVYAGKAGVPRSGVQAASAAVSGLPSSAASRMPVIGRQKLNSYLASQQLMTASAMATLSAANSRAFSSSVLPCCSATIWAMRFRWPGGVAVPAPLAQNRAMAVWSAVRVALVAEPSSLTSLKAAVYSALSSAGGAAGRNWSPLVMANGVTSGQCGVQAGRVGGRRRPPLAGLGAAQVRRQHDAGPVVLAKGQDLVGHGPPQGHAVVLGLAVRDGGERGRQLGVQRGGLGRVEGDQGPVRRRRDGRLPRRLRVGQGIDQVDFVGAVQRVDGVVHRRVRDGHDSRGDGRRRPGRADGVTQDVVPLKDHVGRRRQAVLQGLQLQTATRARQGFGHENTPFRSGSAV